MQAKTLETMRATQGTPRLFVRPMNRGAFPFRDMNSRVRDETYRELLPAEMTLTTIKALMRFAAGRIPAAVSEMVNGEVAVVDEAPSRPL